MNPDRQVLPGLFYHLPTPPDKVSPFTVTEEEFAALAAAAGEGAPADQWLVRTVNGLSPLVARELTFRACGSTDAPVTGHTAALWSAFAAWRDTVNEKHFTPAMLKRSGVPMDFTYLHVGQYGDAENPHCWACWRVWKRWTAARWSFAVHRSPAPADGWALCPSGISCLNGVPSGTT